MFLLVTCISLVAMLRFSSGEECRPEVAGQIARCGQLWGYDEDVITRPQLTARPMINISQLLIFCRRPDRPDISECQREAVGGCDVGWGNEGNALWEKMNDLLGEAVNYVCNQESVLERDQACLDSLSNRMVRCAKVAWRWFVENVKDAATWDDQKQLMEKVGRDREQCTVKVIKNHCNTEVANVFGNFFYGATVYSMDEGNQNRR